MKVAFKEKLNGCNINTTDFGLLTCHGGQASPEGPRDSYGGCLRKTILYIKKMEVTLKKRNLSLRIAYTIS